ncbi:MAG: hypothetical protein HY880_08245, partial [Deltaproteobacteria bacterium]|nr:hypothetical protein [Deltaproteobacteria bacterium]
VLRELERAKKEAEKTASKLGKTIEDLEAFARIAIKRELKLKEIKEENLRLKKGLA